MLSRRSLDDLIDIPVQFSVGAGGDFFQIVDVGPDFRAEGADVGWVAPVCYDSCAAEVDEEARVGSLEETGDEGVDAWFVVRVAVVCPSSIKSPVS